MCLALFFALPARAQYSQYYMPLLPDVNPKGAVDPLPPDIPASVKAQSVPVAAPQQAQAPAPAAAPAAAAQPTAPAAPPPPPDPCADYSTQYEAYVVCKDQLMKIQRMIDARNQREGVVPAAAAPAAANQKADSTAPAASAQSASSPQTQAAPAK